MQRFRHNHRGNQQRGNAEPHSVFEIRMNRRSVDHYRVLGIPFNATEDEIKQAYRQEAKRWHPDVNDSDEAATRFHQATESFEALMGREKGRTGYRAHSSAASVDEEQMAARIRQFRAKAAGASRDSPWAA